MTIIERPIYTKKILGQINRGMILVLVDQRRVGNTLYIQVAYKLSSPETIKREFGN
ncbi:MAG: hypothetical protein NC095_06140 [Muribaculum sp.]|nr:hypothetical protein [Muribaculum sp.]